LSDASHNNAYVKLTGSGGTITANSTPTAGFSCILAHRGSGTKTFSAASGVYLNGASTTVTSVTMALGAVATAIHEGAGKWSLTGSGLT
jgi:hypothetical protein